MLRPPALNDISMDAIIKNEPNDLMGVLQYLDEVATWIDEDVAVIDKITIENRIEAGKLEAKQHNLAYERQKMRGDYELLAGANMARGITKVGQYSDSNDIPPSAEMQLKQRELDLLTNEIDTTAAKRQELLSTNERLKKRIDELGVIRSRTGARLGQKRNLLNSVPSKYNS